MEMVIVLLNANKPCWATAGSNLPAFVAHTYGKARLHLLKWWPTRYPTYNGKHPDISSVGETPGVCFYRSAHHG